MVVEVAAARMVILGWAMNLGPSACVLAAALSLTPSCDVFRTPMKSNRGSEPPSEQLSGPKVIEIRRFSSIFSAFRVAVGVSSRADEVYHSQLRELKQTIEQRSRFDGGHMSEPLALHSLCDLAPKEVSSVAFPKAWNGCGAVGGWAERLCMLRSFEA